MTRASAANAMVCPDEAIERSIARRLAASRPRWAPSAASIGVGLAVLLVVAITVRHLLVERDLALTEAARDVDIRATLIASRLNAALAAAPQASPAEIFKRILEAYPEERLPTVVLVDRAGRRIAADPPQAAGGAELGSDAFTPRGSGSGVVRVSDGIVGDRFAAVRTLPAMAGRVAFASPVEHHLAAWRRAAAVTVLLLGSTVLLVVAAGGLYAADVRGRRRRLRRECVLRNRLDLALNRGRCGLWTWDLHRGRIVWSASMFGILDLAERPAQWTVSELQALMHPDDRSLEGIAQLAVERRSDFIEVDFRMRAADGRWVWLRKRAEIVEDEETGAASPRRHRLRRHRPQARSGSLRDRRPASARRDRGDFGSFRAVGRRQSSGSVQLEISASAQSSGRGRPRPARTTQNSRGSAGETASPRDRQSPIDRPRDGARAPIEARLPTGAGCRSTSGARAMAASSRSAPTSPPSRSTRSSWSNPNGCCLRRSRSCASRAVRWKSRRSSLRTSPSATTSRRRRPRPPIEPRPNSSPI